MRKYIVVIFLFIIQLGEAQEGFIKSYDLQGNGTLFNNMILDDDTLIVAGISISDTFPFAQGIVFAKMDTSGVLIDYKVHIDSAGSPYSWSSQLFGMTKIEDDSGYIFLGHVFGRNNGIVIKLNRVGDLVWTKEYEDDNSLQDYYKKIKEVEGGFLIAGRKFMPNGQGDIFLLKTDKSGNKLWEKSYGLPSRNDDASNLLIINENEYVIGGYIGPNQGVPWNQWHNQIQIFAVDSLGNEKWYWESDPVFDAMSTEDGGCFGLQQDEEGNWVYATTRVEFDFDGATRTQAKFVKRDEDFNLIEEQTYDDTEGRINKIFNVTKLSTGGWLLVGTNSEPVEEPVIALSHIYSWMIRVEESGDSLWTREDLVFPDTTFATEQYLHSAVELSSGSIIAAGYYSSFGIERDHGFLIKVDCQGNVDTLLYCAPISNIATVPSSLDLKVFPNPTSDVLYYESDQIQVWDKVELLDITGQAVSVVFNNKELTLVGLPPGLYILRLWKDGRYWTRKVVRQ